jgi:2-polyprenyl-3-methyl-5-hydroxy-6-metoxy-1,4-benzoquinol methylase
VEDLKKCGEIEKDDGTLVESMMEQEKKEWALMNVMGGKVVFMSEREMIRDKGREQKSEGGWRVGAVE